MPIVAELDSRAPDRPSGGRGVEFGDRKAGDRFAYRGDGRLLRLPAQRSRRRTVLEHVVQSFEPGTRYAEQQLDAVLRTWCVGGGTDHVSLRRHLVDEGLLSRSEGHYWRSGGWVDVLGD